LCLREAQSFASRRKSRLLLLTPVTKTTGLALVFEANRSQSVRYAGAKVRTGKFGLIQRDCEHMANWSIAYGARLTRLRWAFLILGILVSFGAISGIRHLEFTNDYRYFFGEGNPNLAQWEKVQRTYTQTDQLLWVIKPKSGEATDPVILDLIGKITEQAWQVPNSVRVDSLTNYQHTWAEGDDLIVEDLVPDPSAVTQEEADRIKAIALADPVTALRLISADARTTAVMATIYLPKDDTVALTETMRAAREIKSFILDTYPDVEVGLTGSVALSNAFNEATQRDLSTLLPLMILVLGLTVFLLTRSITGTLASLVVVILSAAAAVGTAGWLGTPMSPPSAMAPIIILTVAVADSIHILITTLVNMRSGMEKRPAIVESLRINMGPVFLTSITTAIGFLSLRFSDAPPIRDMGTFSAIGALYAWFLSMTLFPALLAILPLRGAKTIENQSRIMEAIAKPVIAMRVPIILVFVGMGATAAYVLPDLKFDDRFVEYFDTSMEFRQDTDFASANLTGIYQIHYSLGAKTSGGISDPEYLKTLDAFTQYFRSQPKVMNVSSFTDIMKRVNKSLHQDDEAWYRVPEERSMAAEFLLLYEMSLPYGLDLNDQVDVDKSATRFVVTLDTVATAELGQITDKADAWLRENAPAYMHARPAGQAVMFAYIGESNFEAMKLGSAVALFLISLCLMIALRNIRLGILSLVPNVLPPALAFGIFWSTGGTLGIWSVPVFVAALGLIVDATVHFLSKYQRARREKQMDERAAVEYAFRTVGTALLVSTLVLIAGFTILALSSFKMNSALGMMVALTIAVALIVDFLLLPALLVTFDKRKVSQPRT
jgi:uncharacterized protein